MIRNVTSSGIRDKKWLFEDKSLCAYTWGFTYMHTFPLNVHEYSEQTLPLPLLCPCLYACLLICISRKVRAMKYINVNSHGVKKVQPFYSHSSADHFVRFITKMNNVNFLGKYSVFSPEPVLEWQSSSPIPSFIHFLLSVSRSSLPYTVTPSRSIENSFRLIGLNLIYFLELISPAAVHSSCYSSNLIKSVVGIRTYQILLGFSHN